MLLWQQNISTTTNNKSISYSFKKERLGIYIKSVVPGGAADLDGRLQAGDQLLSVDKQSLIGITQEKYVFHIICFLPRGSHLI